MVVYYKAAQSFSIKKNARGDTRMRRVTLALEVWSPETKVSAITKILEADYSKSYYRRTQSYPTILTW